MFTDAHDKRRDVRVGADADSAIDTRTSFQVSVALESPKGSRDFGVLSYTRNCTFASLFAKLNASLGEKLLEVKVKSKGDVTETAGWQGSCV
jgi:hypothetical protein